MALRKIVKDPDPQLRRKSRCQEVFDEKLHKTLDDMRETMIANDGCGLAAPQIGILRRYAVVEAGDFFLEMVNPVITHQEGSQISPEGCLSVNGKNCLVERPMRITLEYDDRNGKHHTKEIEGFPAKACCHEIDHLDGILFYDKEYRNRK